MGCAANLQIPEDRAAALYKNLAGSINGKRRKKTTTG